MEPTPNHCRVSSYTRNLKHVDRFSLKQLNKALRSRGAAKAGNAYASMSCLRLRSTLGKVNVRTAAGNAWDKCWTAAKVHTAHCHYSPVCRRMKIHSCRCCLLQTFTMLWMRVCVAAACEDSLRGTVPMVERVDGAILQAARIVQVWKTWSGMFGTSPGTGNGATLWLELLYCCQSEETMGGMRWLSRCVW